MSFSPHLDEKKLLVGKIHGVFGVQGWVKIFSYTKPRKNILEYQPWYFVDNETYKVIEITSGREQSKTIVAQVKGINNRDEALQLIGKDLYINKDRLPEIDNDAHYWHELTGFRVINKNEVDLGIVDYLVDTGSNHVLVTKGNTEHWIPYIEPFLVSVNKHKKVISVDWDENF